MAILFVNKQIMQKVQIIGDLDQKEELYEETATIKKVANVAFEEEIGRGAFAIVYKGIFYKVNFHR